MRISIDSEGASRLAIRFTCLAAVCGTGMALVPAGARAQPQPCVTINPRSGPSATICGTVSPPEDDFTADQFLGIRYSDAQRFEAKETPLAPSGQIPATKAGAVCAQYSLATQGVVGKEDCLFLNVWRPTGTTAASRLPVLVFIHGGAFVEGGSTGVGTTHLLFNGTELTHRWPGGLVVVTLNYRLGALGFLVGKDSTGSLTGNYGFLDQVAALNWVHQYIQYFGGDPDRVTIVGQSAGAISVGLHAWSSTKSAGLFRQVVMESNPLGVALPDPPTAMQAGHLLACALKQLDPCPATLPNTLPCTTVTCLKNKTTTSTEDLVTASFAAFLAGIQGFSNTPPSPGSSLLPWGPNLDGKVIERQPLEGAEKRSFTGPVLFGTNRDEGAFFEAEISASTDLTGIYYNNFVSALLNNVPGASAGLPPEYQCQSGASDCGPQFAKLVTDYVFTCTNHALGQLAGKWGPSQVFAYQFRHQPSFPYPIPSPSLCDHAVCHSDELPFVWDNAAGACDSCQFKPQENTLATTMTRLWAAMAGQGNPNFDGYTNTTWPGFGAANGNYLVLDLGSFPVNTTIPTEANCPFWQGVSKWPPSAAAPPPPAAAAAAGRD